MANFFNKFVNVLEFSVYGDVADVGNRIDVVELVHDFHAYLRGGNFADMVFVEVGNYFIHCFV